MTRPALFAALLTGILGTASRADVDVAPPPRPKGVPFTPPPAANAENPAETVGKIIQNAKDVTERLSKSDTSTTTRKKQDDTLVLIDKLINRQDEPPQSGGDDNKDDKDKKDKGDSKDKKGDGDGKKGDQPKDGDGKGGMGEKEPGKGGRRPRSEQGKEPGGKGGEPMDQTGDAKASDGKTPGGDDLGKMDGRPPKAQLPADDDVAKDVWGHLPDKLRQQVTAYYKEEFMPRYADLLKQYYSSLSSKPGEKK